MVTVKPFGKFQRELEGKKVLVTGAPGFVGGRLAERLALEHGADVRALVRDWTKATWVSRFNLELVLGDLRDSDAAEQMVAGCDIVVHCASGGGSPAEYMAINKDGTQNLLEACSKLGVERFVYISTIAVHGADFPCDTNERTEFRRGESGYADSKIAAEELVVDYHQRKGLPVVIIRPTYVWGPRSALFTVGPLRQMTKGRFLLVDDGQGDCHAVFIETLVDSIIASAILPEAIGKAFIVSDGYGLDWREFFAAHGKLLDKTEFPSLSSTSWIVNTRCASYQRLTQLLEKLKGSPAPLWRRGLRRSIRIIADWLASIGVMSQKDLRKFSRIGRLDTSEMRNVLKTAPRYSFEEAMSITSLWVQDQLAFEFDIEDTD